MSMATADGSKEEWWGEPDSETRLPHCKQCGLAAETKSKRGHLQCAGNIYRCCCGAFNQRRGLVERIETERKRMAAESTQRVLHASPVGFSQGSMGCVHDWVTSSDGRLQVCAKCKAERRVEAEPEQPVHAAPLPRCGCRCSCQRIMRAEQKYQTECDPCALGVHAEMEAK